MDDGLKKVLLECQDAVSVLDESLRGYAFQALLGHRLGNAQIVASSSKRATRPEVGAIADLFRACDGARERLLVAIHAADEAGEGVTLTDIRSTLSKHRQPQPGNLSRDVGELIKAGLVLTIDGSRRDAKYGLSQKGFDFIGDVTLRAR